MSRQSNASAARSGSTGVVLVVHDTGGAIGLRWASPDAVTGMVITNTGFFPDYEWHELGKAMRTEGQGEALVDSLSRDGLAALLDAASTGSTGRRSTSAEAFSTRKPPRDARAYRSFDLDELEPYQGKLAGSGAHADPLGEQTSSSPRLRRAQGDPGAELVLLEGSPFPVRGRAGALRPRGEFSSSEAGV